jgi:hypothetical protein
MEYIMFDLSKDELKLELGLMINSENWPLVNVLPVKNSLLKPSEGWPKFGILKDNHLPIVYEVDLFDLPQTNEEWLAAPRHGFDSFTDLIKAGWIVD